MKGLTEFAMAALISNQIQIGETFETMHKLTTTNLEDLELQSADYPKKSMDALCQLWNNFDDNHHVLKEAKLQVDSYYTDNVYKKVKEEYRSVITALRDFRTTDKQAKKSEKSEEIFKSKSVTSNEKSAPSPDELIRTQRILFNKLQDTIKILKLDDINNPEDLEKCQKNLQKIWKSIDFTHGAIRNEFEGGWPDLTYELDYVRYKNMNETTLSLLNYKIDAIVYPIYFVVPHIGIPTWRMFDNQSEVHPFTVNSFAWAKIEALADVIRTKKISEGEKRQLLIRIFLTYQTTLNPNKSKDFSAREDEGDDSMNTPNVVNPQAQNLGGANNWEDDDIVDTPAGLFAYLCSKIF